MHSAVCIVNVWWPHGRRIATYTHIYEVQWFSRIYVRLALARPNYVMLNLTADVLGHMLMTFKSWFTIRCKTLALPCIMLALMLITTQWKARTDLDPILVFFLCLVMKNQELWICSHYASSIQCNTSAIASYCLNRLYLHVHTRPVVCMNVKYMHMHSWHGWLGVATMANKDTYLWHF